jgi:hypothetical protein
MTKHVAQDLDDLHRQDLESSRKAFAAGNEAGLYDALVYCKREKLSLPEWALDATIVRQRDYLFGESKRHAKWLRQFKTDMIDMDRAEMVMECRERKAPWRETYKAASQMLKGTEVEGGPAAIKKSYLKFIRTMKTNPYRYYISKFVHLKERHRLPDPEHIKWLDKKFPFPKDGGPRRYRRT